MFINLKEENKLVYVKYDSDNIVNILDKGIYDVESIYGNLFFAPNKAFEKGKVAKAGIYEQVSTYMSKYFSENGKKVRKLMNLQTRIGMFFKGQPGTGKTFLAAKLALELIERENGVGIYTTNLGAFDPTDVVDAIRIKDPNRLVVFIFDEFEKSYNNLNKGTRDNLLAFLDGGRSRDNVIVFATANSLAGIPPTLLERPGRFEKVLEFRITDDSVLDNLIEGLIPDELMDGIDKAQIKKYVKALDGELTIDKLKSVIRDCLIHFLDTGQLFPNDISTLLTSLSKETIKKDSAKDNQKKDRRSNNISDALKDLINSAIKNEKTSDRQEEVCIEDNEGSEY